MAQLLVRHLDDDVKLKLQHRARRHGRSTEEEVREILRNAVREESGARVPLGSRLAARFAGLGLAEDIPELRGQPVTPEEAARLAAQWRHRLSGRMKSDSADLLREDRSR